MGDVPKPPKRAKTAYFLFMDDKRPEYIKEHPGAVVAEVGKAMGELWANTPADEKKYYEELHIQAKEAQKREMDEYVAKYGEPEKPDRKRAPTSDKDEDPKRRKRSADPKGQDKKKNKSTDRAPGGKSKDAGKAQKEKEKEKEKGGEKPKNAAKAKEDDKGKGRDKSRDKSKGKGRVPSTNKGGKQDDHAENDVRPKKEKKEKEKERVERKSSTGADRSPSLPKQSKRAKGGKDQEPADGGKKEGRGQKRKE